MSEAKAVSLLDNELEGLEDLALEAAERQSNLPLPPSDLLSVEPTRAECVAEPCAAAPSANGQASDKPFPPAQSPFPAQSSHNRDWCRKRAYKDLPASVPPAFRELWFQCFELARAKKPMTVVRATVREGASFTHEARTLDHGFPNVLEVVTEIGTMMVNDLNDKIAKLSADVEAQAALAARIPLSTIKKVCYANLAEMLVADDLKVRFAATFKALGHIERMISGAQKKKIGDELLDEEDTDQDVMLKLQEFHERKAKEDALFGQGH